MPHICVQCVVRQQEQLLLVLGAVAGKHFRPLTPSTEIREFSENVRVLVQLLSSQAEVIEAEKLKVRAVAPQAMDRPTQR